MYVCLLCLLTVISQQKQTVKLIVLLQLFDPSVVYYLTMATRITLLSDLKTIDDSHLAITFTENLDSIFSYNHKDIANTLDERVADALTSLRNELFEKIKTNFPEYQSKCLIARKAKHLLIQDIIQFGYSLVNKNVTREMEKAFSKNDPSSHTNETDPPGEGPPEQGEGPVKGLSVCVQRLIIQPPALFRAGGFFVIG